MQKRLYRMGIPRRIEAGESVSGFVFTNDSPGTKNLLVDLFSAGEDDQTFVFFL